MLENRCASGCFDAEEGEFCQALKGGPKLPTVGN